MPKVLSYMPFIRIGGKALFRPVMCAHLQCDGSFRMLAPHATRTAWILHSADERLVYREVKIVGRAESSTEAEWASVYEGVDFALGKGETALEVENDCLAVFSGLTVQHAVLKQSYARYYARKIQRLANESEWMAVRWIPRELNLADKLFR
jgi:ribonuclease HI